MGNGMPAERLGMSLDARAGSPDPAYDAAIEYARAEGQRRGQNAAEWYIGDALSVASGLGQRGRDVQRDAARAILAGIEDGDPEVLDTLPAPDLSGQWADGLTGPQLAHDALFRGGVSSEDDAYDAAYDGAFSDICDAYETAFSQAATDAIETAARAMLA